MPATAYEREQTVLRSMVPGLEADGFQVMLQPGHHVLPPFLDGYRPDLVAFGPKRNLAIEVISHSQETTQKERRLRDLFAAHPEWELRFVYAPPPNADNAMPAPTPTLVSEHADRLEASVEVMGYGAALLYGWALFEAAARCILPESLDRPQPAARLLEILAFEGEVTPDDADRLRGLSAVRNQLAHGRLDQVPARDDVGFLLRVIRKLLEEAA